MPRCGHASCRANARPLLSRPITRGFSSSVVFCNSPRFSLSPGIARYQNPNSMSESGVWRWGASSSIVEYRRVLQARTPGLNRPILWTVRTVTPDLDLFLALEQNVRPGATRELPAGNYPVFSWLLLLLRWFYRPSERLLPFAAHPIIDPLWFHDSPSGSG